MVQADPVGAGDSEAATAQVEVVDPPVPAADPTPPESSPDDTVELTGTTKTKKKSPWWLKAMLIVGALVLVVSGGGLILLNGLADRYESKVERQNILEGVPEPPPQAEEGGPLNFLVLGTDSREEEKTASLDETGARSDTIMLVHVTKGLQSAFIVSIPRDAYVEIPAGGAWRGGKNKINAALSYGGANLAARAIYDLTRIPLDGAMIVNFNGVRQIIGAVGGVHVCTPYTVRSTFSSKVWEKGCHDMGPEDAEEFMRQRKLVPGGDFGRIKSQHLVIKALAEKITSGGTLTNPARLDRLLTTAAESLTVDQNLNLRELAFALKGIRPGDITFATAPFLHTMETTAGSSVELDKPGCAELFAAVREDRTAAWLAAHPQSDVATFEGSG